MSLPLLRRARNGVVGSGAKIEAHFDRERWREAHEKGNARVTRRVYLCLPVYTALCSIVGRIRADLV
ncbi:hypothetical protein HBI56_159000 [Parastagonospora nodorum]|uniref:Uncharacterized protein n=1 Tax=Phaeosphaeria nodorum (strain SN15 / ATCC MYA-4574 / FGSC 10173) TaxID=321614 RepID=A0A7U2ESR6_PHANO|nr:hypothetical protein HBH56_189720 [Parastagonospora nodorum]QRC92348.1 hypothetical protein JI435_402320 [Parastagonospora nodorum SN15]KAH3925036.1 hypothetical protein HBH54_185530 [Parastagonospora nodorum]KAH3994711.1 hypothetical protein HBI10_183220 [Parastagonospora nodorum]KAH4014039.1 hypothetical protein HBI13_175320 [Parastagonospora nodorum]